MTKTLTAGGLLAVLFVGDLAYADVPTAADMIACNEEARDAVRGRTTSPTAKDEARAEDARKGGRNTTERTDATGTITQSPDPQIEGMDARGAKRSEERRVGKECRYRGSQDQ